MMTNFSQEQRKELNQRINLLEDMLQRLKSLPHCQEKLMFLSKLPTVRPFIQQNSWLMPFLEGPTKLQLTQAYALYAIIAIGEGPIVFRGYDQVQDLTAHLLRLSDKLS